MSWVYRRPPRPRQARKLTPVLFSSGAVDIVASDSASLTEQTPTNSVTTSASDSVSLGSDASTTAPQSGSDSAALTEQTPDIGLGDSDSGTLLDSPVVTVGGTDSFSLSASIVLDIAVDDDELITLLVSSLVEGPLTITALTLNQFHRINGQLVLAPVGRSTRRGFRTSEGYERVSDTLGLDQHPASPATTEKAMTTVASAWATDSGSSVATLKTAIHAALQAAGFRGPNGENLT